MMSLVAINSDTRPKTIMDIKDSAFQSGAGLRSMSQKPMGEGELRVLDNPHPGVSGRDRSIQNLNMKRGVAA